MDENELRAEFERQHKGRNLRRHRLRGTYSAAPIAALWNQHKRTAEWLERKLTEAQHAAQYWETRTRLLTGPAVRHTPEPEPPILTDAEFEKKRAEYTAAGFADLAPCCKQEKRGFNGGCVNCGDPCF